MILGEYPRSASIGAMRVVALGWLLCTAVDAPSPRSAHERATWSGRVREVAVPLVRRARESDLPNQVAPVSLGWQRQKQAQSSLGSSVGGG